MKLYTIICTTVFAATSILMRVKSHENYNHDVWDKNIFTENKEWVPSITSGPTILVASNMSTISNQNGEDVKVQLSNNNIGIGTFVIPYQLSILLKIVDIRA